MAVKSGLHALWLVRWRGGFQSQLWLQSEAMWALQTKPREPGVTAFWEFPVIKLEVKGIPECVGCGSDLGRGRLQQVKGEVRSSQGELGAWPCNPTEGNRDGHGCSFASALPEHGWTAGHTVGSGVCLEGVGGGYKKTLKVVTAPRPHGKNYPWLPPFSNFPFLFLFPSDLFWLGCSLHHQAQSLCMGKTSGLTRRWSGRTWGCACSTTCSSTTSPPRSTCCSMATSKSLTAANKSSTKKWRGIKVAEKGERAVRMVVWWCQPPAKLKIVDWRFCCSSSLGFKWCLAPARGINWYLCCKKTIPLLQGVYRLLWQLFGDEFIGLRGYSLLLYSLPWEEI